MPQINELSWFLISLKCLFCSFLVLLTLNYIWVWCMKTSKDLRIDFLKIF